MFLDNSRYVRIAQVEVPTAGGTVKAVKLRRLPTTDGEATMVKGNDRLDVMALRSYQDPTRFWHIADANTELRAGDLVAEPGRSILVPKS
jgi:hypothetical protein